MGLALVDLVHSGFDCVEREGPSPQDFETDLKPAPETALFQAVVFQAWEDAFSESLKQVHGRDADDRAHTRDIIRHEARRWLTMEYGKWREDRDFVCGLAGLNPGWIKMLAKKRIAAEKRPAKVVQLEFPQSENRSASELNIEIQRLLAA